MYVHETQVRVRYAETDQMSYVYYGNYAQYYEVGRVEALRALGMSYKQIEAKGIMLPVTHLQVRYMKPALYDDLLTIRTMIKAIPGSKIDFHYEIYNEAKVKINEGSVTLLFIDAVTGKRSTAPEELVQSLLNYFEALPF